MIYYSAIYDILLYFMKCILYAYESYAFEG